MRRDIQAGEIGREVSWDVAEDWAFNSGVGELKVKRVTSSAAAVTLTCAASPLNKFVIVHVTTSSSFAVAGEYDCQFEVRRSGVLLLRSPVFRVSVKANVL